MRGFYIVIYTYINHITQCGVGAGAIDTLCGVRYTEYMKKATKTAREAATKTARKVTTKAAQRTATKTTRQKRKKKKVLTTYNTPICDVEKKLGFKSGFPPNTKVGVVLEKTGFPEIAELLNL